MTLNKLLFACSLLSVLFSFSIPAAAQDAAAPSEAVIKGEDLFKSQCASCHKVNAKLIGPALAGVTQRWEEAGEFKGLSGKQWLHKWIKNSPGTISEGYPYAVEMSNFDPSVMQSFGQLNDEQIDQILGYVDFIAGGGKMPGAEPVASDQPAGEAGGSSPYANVFLYLLVAMLAILALILGRVTTVLNRLVREKEGLPIPVPVPFYKNKKIITTVVLLLLIYVGYTAVNSAIDLGRQQGYAPDQPIKFSHALHAGINEIDCKYCHTGAAKGKQSNIPSLNVCMNCHKGVNEAPLFGKYGRKEIAKIYASIGFNPNELKYIEDYENMPQEEVKALFTDWLKADANVPQSQEDIDEVLALAQKPIEWVRIHNLPDHVYFNHAQHVTAGQVECQTCHGQVQEMEVLAQHAPLSMGWCVNCHRTTEVKFSTNAYYDIYEKYHQDIEEGKMSKVTVDNIGGTECQKCHY